MILEEEDYLHLLLDRLEYWKPTEMERKLFSKYYEHLVEEQIVQELDLTVMQIVDNDYVNYLSVVDTEDDRFNELFEQYDKNGLGEYDGIIIETVDDENNPKAFLVRYC